MTTLVRSNGSKWAGEAPDTVDQLIAVLRGEYALDATFEDYGGFATVAEDWYLEALDAGLAPGAMHFSGNFYELSHVFDIVTDDPAVIDALIAAIRANQATPAYQVSRDERAAEKARRAAREAEFINRNKHARRSRR